MIGPADPSADSNAALLVRMGSLERRVRRLQALLAGGTVAVCLVATAAFKAQPSPDDVVVTTRRLVLTDSQGKAGATIELGRPLVPVGSGDRFQESASGQALMISIADKEAGITDSVAAQGAEIRLSPRLFTVMFGGWVPPGRSLNPDEGSGMALSARPALELTSRGTMMFRVDPGSKFYRPVSAPPGSQ